MAERINNKLQYTGKVQPQSDERDDEGKDLYPYLPDDTLVEAVNLALLLERPLLIKGEPGSGKTRLARAVAYELKIPYKAWPVKSTSKARDGFYIYDSVGRLRDAQLAAHGHKVEEDRSNNSENYIKWGPLGEAFRSEQQTVVLIDEIDKADIDFPNDLLLVLDEKYFFVDETQQKVEAKKIPLIIITSNDEKELSDAFLRRCLVYPIEFPDSERLKEIVDAHFPASPSSLIDAVVERFLELRHQMEKDKGEEGKKVSTSELIDWFEVLHYHPQDEVLAKLKGRLPYPSVLLKSWDDHKRYLKSSVE